MEDTMLYKIMDEISQRKAKRYTITKTSDIMKLLICLQCGDVFNLSKKEKVCGCGKTGGKYIDNLNAEYFGEGQPIGFANGSFMEAIKVQRIENKIPKRKNECCKGVEFTAFFIPDAATSLTKIN